MKSAMCAFTAAALLGCFTMTARANNVQLIPSYRANRPATYQQVAYRGGRNYRGYGNRNYAYRAPSYAYRSPSYAYRYSPYSYGYARPNYRGYSYGYVPGGVYGYGSRGYYRPYGGGVGFGYSPYGGGYGYGPGIYLRVW